MSDDSDSNKEYNSPLDDQGVTTQNVLEIGEELIKRVWKKIKEEENLSIDEMEKLANITDISYGFSVGAIRIGTQLTRDYLESLDDDDDDEDFDDEDENGDYDA